LIIPNNI